MDAAAVAAVVQEVDAALRAQGDPERAAQEKRYLRGVRDHYGARVPAVRAVAKGVARRHPDLDHEAVVALAGALWEAPVHERKSVTVELLITRADRLGPADVPMLERMLRDARTWALVDGFALSVVGPLVERHPDELGSTLDRWAADDDLWLRRSALLALLLPIRRGDGDVDRFLRYADAMLDEREFFVRKAIGWVLRDLGRTRPDVVDDWLLPRVGRASGVTVREALKPLTPGRRDAVLAAHRRVTAGDRP